MRLCGSRLLVSATVLVTVVGTALITGCGEKRPTVLMPVAPVPVELTFDQVAAKAKAGESDWAIIWPPKVRIGFLLG